MHVMRIRLFAALIALVSASTAGVGIAQSLIAGSAQSFQDCPTCPKMIPISGAARGGTATAVAATETTWAQYLQAVKARACPTPFIYFRPESLSDERLIAIASINYPIDHGVSLDKVECYARWLSNLKGRHYRLPTEAEWLAFAKAGATTRFPWGDQLERDRAAINGWVSKVPPIPPFNHVIYGGMPVASFAPSAAGIYDVIGGAREMTSTCKQPELSDLSSNEKRKRGCLLVSKGGDYGSRPEELGLDSKRFVFAAQDDPAAGFRLVVE